MNAMAMTIDTEVLPDGRKIKVRRARAHIAAVIEQGLPVTIGLSTEERDRRAVAVVYAEKRLMPWADWIRSHRQRLGYPTISLIYKAMRRKAVRLRTILDDLAVDEHGNPVNLLTALGTETRSMQPAKVGECSDEIAEVDQVVAELPDELYRIVIVDCFTYGGIQVKCAETPYKRARYSQLLECAKYSIYQGLKSLPCF